MRTVVGSLALLALSTCGESLDELDGGSRDDNADADQIVIPDSGRNTPECVRSEQPASPHYDGSTAWTQTEVDACSTSCPDLADACVASECPGIAEFEACSEAEFNACITAEDGACRGTWEEAMCCALSNCDTELEDAAYVECVAEKCGEQRAAYRSCADLAIETKGQCLETSVTACLAESDGGVAQPGDAGVDSGVAAYDGGEASDASTKRGIAVQIRLPIVYEVGLQKLLRR